MVDLAVIMVIPTTYDNTCFDLYNARKFEKSSKILAFTYLANTMTKLRKIIEMDFINHLSRRPQLLNKLFPTLLTRIRIQNIE